MDRGKGILSIAVFRWVMNIVWKPEKIIGFLFLVGNLNYIQEYSQRCFFMQMIISADDLLIGLMYTYVYRTYMNRVYNDGQLF
jgi:hypothetical protein